MRRLLPVLLFVVVPAVAAAQEGVSAVGTEHLTRYLDGEVAAGRAAGIVALVMRDGKVVYQHATGMADREAGRPMRLDTRFRIASQTKAITTVAAMTLVEEGRMGLGDPISRWLPAFARMTVAEAYDSAGATGHRVVPAKRSVTVRQLMTHTAGMSYGTESWLAAAYAARGLGPEAGWGWYFADKSTDICTAVAPLADLPLAAQPGERWVYGYGTDVLGCLIERESGQSLADFVRQRITDPLGMQHTSFCLDGAQGKELAAVYMLSDGKIARAPDGPRGQGDYVDGPCRAFSGGAGLVSTAGDYARFLEMLREGGTLDGVRVVSPATVRLMTRDHVGELYGGDQVGFGLAFEILEDPGHAARYGEAGAYSWGGAYHTMYWVDPAYDLVAVMMVQLLPANGSRLQDRYKTLVYQMLR